jgi:hypothetical protein
MSPDQKYPRRYTPEGDRLPAMYHGTATGLQTGQAVEPGHESTRRETGRTAMHAAQHGSMEHAYATPDLAEAYKYATEASAKNGGKGGCDPRCSARWTGW